jgi:IS605 OrfB family transposase
LVTELLKLSPDAGQREALLETMRAGNAAADRAAEVAFAHRTANKITSQKLVYAHLRAVFALPAQLAIRTIDKACQAYKRDKRAGAPPQDWLGVDLGIVNLATDSHGTAYSGRAVRAVRFRNRTLRARLQRKGTKSARRLLKKRRRAEARFARNTNHVISKRLVGKAKDTRTGIALEDLGGIRERVTVTKAQRADLHAWSFRQLRTFVTYKAALAGVHVRLVDPRNTSRTCPPCGHCAKRNRPHRDSFLCVACRFAGPADHIAAINNGRRAVSHAADDAA